MRTGAKLVGLFGLFGTGNAGNDGSLELMLVFLRRVAPEEQLLCICGNPAVIEEAFGLDAIPIYQKPREAAEGRITMLLQKALGRTTLWLYAIRHLRKLKVLIIPGTGVLDDFAVNPLGWPHDVLSWWLLARLMGVKVILASIGAGPIHHPVSRWLMKSAARAAHYRSYRDTVSKSFMDSIGFDTQNDPIYPDIAFRLPAPLSARPQTQGDAPLRIGLGVMTYQGWRNDSVDGAGIYALYLEKITDFALWLLKRGHVVRVLMGEVSDRRAVDDLILAVRQRHPDLAEDALLFEPATTLHDVMRQMTDVDLVVATRYHNVVCALKLDKPTISIGYADKNDALLTEMGLADFCQQIEQLDVERLKAQTTRMVAELPAFKRRIVAVRTQFEDRLREQEEVIRSLIDDPSR